MNNKAEKYILQLVKAGLSKAEAKIIVSEYAEADMARQASHGLATLPSLISRLSERKGPPKVLKSSGAITLIDGRRELGQLTATQAVKVAVKKAGQYGISFVGLKNILAFACPGTFARKIAEKGMIGLVMIDGGGPVLTHPDSITPVLGTNPLAFAIPTAKGIWFFDMATSKRNWSDVGLYKRLGKKLVPNTYRDKQGNFITDPNLATSVIPFGDYKGFALAMLVGILSNGLLGMGMGRFQKLKPNGNSYVRGAVFIAIDPKKFSQLPKFKTSVTNLMSDIKAAQKIPGVKSIRIPGEKSSRRLGKLK